MPNGRCRMHGGTNPGAPMGERNGAYRHGHYTNEAVERRRQFHALMKAARQTLDMAERS